MKRFVVGVLVGLSVLMMACQQNVDDENIPELDVIAEYCIDNPNISKDELTTWAYDKYGSYGVMLVNNNYEELMHPAADGWNPDSGIAALDDIARYWSNNSNLSKDELADWAKNKYGSYGVMLVNNNYEELIKRYVEYITDNVLWRQ